MDQKTGCQKNKKRRNSNRRKAKSASNLQDDGCEEEIKEIINCSSNDIIESRLGKIIQYKSLQEESSGFINNSLVVIQNCGLQKNMVKTEDNRLPCNNNSVAFLNNMRQENMEQHENLNCKSPLLNSCLGKKANLKISFEELNAKNPLESEKSTSNKHKFIDSVSSCCEARGFRKRSRENNKCKYNSKADKEKKSQMPDKVEMVEKSVKEAEEAQVMAGECDDQNVIVINSSLSCDHAEKRTVGKKNSGGGSKEFQSETSKTSKSEKKWLTDTKFPKYLTEEEMDCVSRFGILLSGVIRINQKNFKEAYITAPDRGMDILIVGLIDRNRALEGDEVYYVVKGQEHFRNGRGSCEMQRTAAVVAIKSSQHCRGAVGTLKLQDDSCGSAFFTPRDCRIPRIIIRKRDLPPWFFEEPPTSFDKRLFYAKIKHWNDVRYAEGILTREVGSVGDIDSETSAILLMLELDETPYPDSLTIYLPKLPYVISEEDLTNRRDFREECIFTIDPASAKDLDDAVSCKRLSNGNYEIGVHISDVTHFLREGSPLDAAVAERATTIYLVQKVYHMLPRELCELCSLTPGEDKLAFSVVWEITPDLEIVAYNFTRSIINSCGKFSYDQVQEILDGLDNPSMPELSGAHTVQDVINSVNMLNCIAVSLRKKRFDDGALRIDQTKIVFSLDEAGLPLNYHAYISKEAHRLIEEFMLLANITVAQWISFHFPNIAFLRSHSPPQSFMMNRIQTDLKNYGIDLDILSSKALHSSLMKYNGSDLLSRARMVVLNTMLAKPMARANYYCSAFSPEDDDKRHYALNVPLYTHFTSPIRRYADIMVHRLLAASLGYCHMPDWTPEGVQKVADNCNKKKYAAKLAGEKSTELFLNKYILEQGPLICQGAVCEVKQKFFDCILIENGSHQRVYMEENTKVVWSSKNEDGIWKFIVNWPKSEDKEKEVQVIERFSVVKVKVRKSKDEKNIKAILLRPE